MVLDSAQTAIPGATINIVGTAVTGTTDAEGQFLLTGVPVGPITLHIDPTTSPRPETFPPLEFETVTIAGNENILGQAIILPEIDMPNAQTVGGASDVTLVMKNMPGVELKVFANSTTFKNGSKTGTVSISQVHMDQVPMQPPNGSIPPLAGTLQPLGAKYDPPVRMQFPNINVLPPGTITELFQFHHDTSRFVPVGKGTVSEDGRFVVSDPGFGLPTGGWHLGGSLRPVGRAGNCKDNGDTCSQGALTSNGKCVQFFADGKGPGFSCEQVDGFHVFNEESDKDLMFGIGQSCTKGKCNVKAVCKPDINDEVFRGRFDPEKIVEGINGALERFGSNCLPTKVKQTVNDALEKIRGVDKKRYMIECTRERDLTKAPFCGTASTQGGPHANITLTQPTSEGCAPMKVDVFHEMLHDLLGISHKQKIGPVSGKVRDYAIDPIEACVYQCFEEIADQIYTVNELPNVKTNKNCTMEKLNALKEEEK